MSYQPITVACPLCNDDDSSEPMHRECLLRSALGGIGHLLDHRHWCLLNNDTDAGLGRRDSARCVEALVRRYGVEAVVDETFPPTTLSEVCEWAGVSV
jgi:hypothetical protein